MMHNKKRNSAFLFEILSRELAKASFNNEEDKKVFLVVLIKETFGNNQTELAKDLKLYQNLQSINVKRELAERLLQETKKERQKVDLKRLQEEQDALLKKINEKLTKDVFSNFVPNYKRLATISQIFNVKTPIKDRVVLEENLVCNMANKSVEKEQLEPMGKLAYQLFLKKYNEHYGSKLLEEQKELLRNYIMSFTSGVPSEFHFYLNETIGKLKRQVTELLKTKEITEDEAIKQKTAEVVKLLEGMNKHKVDDKMLKNILAIQELVNEAKGEEKNEDKQE